MRQSSRLDRGRPLRSIGADGHLIYQRGDSLLAILFNPEQLAVLGPPVQIVSGVRQSSWSLGQFAISRGGLLVHAPGGQQSLHRKLVWVDRQGSVEQASDLAAEFNEPRVRGDAFRTGLPRLFKSVDAFGKPEASGKPCAVCHE
jgi:hypothetical protein